MNKTDTYWAMKRRERAGAAAPAPSVVADEKPATKAELIAQAEAAGVEVKATDNKAEIAAKLAEAAGGVEG
jgi:hypothetical protein